MTDAGVIAEQLGVENVVASEVPPRYYVVGITDPADLQTVDGYHPIPDPNPSE